MKFGTIVPQVHVKYASIDGVRYRGIAKLVVMNSPLFIPFIKFND